LITPPVKFRFALGACFLAQGVTLPPAKAQQSHVAFPVQSRKRQARAEVARHVGEAGARLPEGGRKRHTNRPEIIDSALTREEALAGETIPDAIRRDLTLVTVSYWSFDHRMHQGQIVIHKDLASDVRSIFQELQQRRFPIAHVIPIAHYHWSDDDSMAANNTSGFNYRKVPGHDKLSNHAYGRAIDINPVQNPFIQNGVPTPPGAVYQPGQPGTITEGAIVRMFERRGWRWGGRWRAATDWQHFDKVAGHPLKTRRD